MNRTFFYVVGALTLVASAAHGQAPLVARWTMDQTQGLVASDSSLNANHGSLMNFSGNPWVPGRYGNALPFNGAANYVMCATNSGLPIYAQGAPFSLGFWIKAPAQVDRVAYGEGNSQQYNGLNARFTLGSGLANTSSRLRVTVRNNGGGDQLARESTTPVFDDTWHHVLWVDDAAGGARLYVDGVQDATDFTYSPTGIFSLDRVGLGGLILNWPCCRMAGTLDDVRIYPFILTATDVATVMANGTLGTGFQPNQPGAAMDVDGFSGSISSAGTVVIPLNGAYSLNLTTSQGGFPWELATNPSPAIQSGLVLDPANTSTSP